MPVGFRVKTSRIRPDPGDVAAFESLEVANIADAMNGIGLLTPDLRPLTNDADFVGVALTVNLSPGDGFMLRHAIELAEPGDVLVVNAFGDTSRAVLGGNVAMAIKKRGVVGLVIDGALRDLEEIRTVGLPVHARGIATRSGTTMCGTGEVNYPIACGAVVVAAGDIVKADHEGIVVIPRADIAEVLERAAQIQGVKGDATNVTIRLHAAGKSVKAMDAFRASFDERGGQFVP